MNTVHNTRWYDIPVVLSQVSPKHQEASRKLGLFWVGGLLSDNCNKIWHCLSYININVRCLCRRKLWNGVEFICLIDALNRNSHWVSFLLHFDHVLQTKTQKGWQFDSSTCSLHEIILAVWMDQDMDNFFFVFPLNFHDHTAKFSEWLIYCLCHW